MLYLLIRVCVIALIRITMHLKVFYNIYYTVFRADTDPYHSNCAF